MLGFADCVDHLGPSDLPKQGFGQTEQGRLVEWAAQSGCALQPNQLRLCYIGGSQIDPTRKAQAETLLGLQLHHGYGLTESAPAATRTIGYPPPSKIT